MENLVHGGDWAGYRAQFGRDALDFSANVSPLGTPEAVARAIGAAAYRADRYPDPLCRELCAALGEAEGVPKDWILCGNGATDLIFRLALAKRPRYALVLAPTFAEYEAALETVGCDVRRCALDEANDFAMTEDVLGAIQPPVEIVFLCQPNNPTGQAADRALMRRILAKCEAVGALLAVDECFLDFLPDGEALTMKPELAAHGGLFILKAFTKLYGMAGVRLGYGLCADTALLERMRRAGQPWAVSSLAQAAGLAALTQRDYVRQVRALIETENCELSLSGRIDALYERGGLPVVEEIKLFSGVEREAPLPAHRAQAVVYAYLLEVPEAVVRVLYVRSDGREAAAFEETMRRGEICRAFFDLLLPYLEKLERETAWRSVRDASLAAMRFPFEGWRGEQRKMAAQVYWVVNI